MADRKCILVDVSMRQGEMGKRMIGNENDLEKGMELTIAVDGTVGARLFAITFDLLPPTFVAGTSYSATLLHGSNRLLWLIGVIVVGRRVLIDLIWSVSHLRRSILASSAGACGLDINRV